MNTRREWTEEMGVGDAAIDAQHKDLFGLVGVVSDLSGRETLTPDDETVIDRTLAALRVYVRVHFRDEEKLMSEAGYPGLLEHIEEHKTFSEWLRVLEDARRAPGYATSSLLVHMSKYLGDWLADHILGSDKRYVPYLKAMKTSG